MCAAQIEVVLGAEAPRKLAEKGLKVQKVKLICGSPGQTWAKLWAAQPCLGEMKENLPAPGYNR